MDDMVVSGETFEMIKAILNAHAPKEIKTLALARHNTEYVPDFYAISSDDCIAFPWDRWIYTGAEFAIHPELKVRGE